MKFARKLLATVAILVAAGVLADHFAKIDVTDEPLPKVKSAPKPKVTFEAVIVWDQKNHYAITANSKGEWFYTDISHISS